VDKKEVIKILKTINIVYLATTDGLKPFVRPMKLNFEGDTFYSVTMPQSEKIRQLKLNPAFEFSCFQTSGDNSLYVRCKGICDIVDFETFEKRYATVNFSKEEHSPNDYLYIIYKIKNVWVNSGNNECSCDEFDK
jgi:uncharacterized pyridoxamine 5'-phosphate oxidase family protein